MIGFLCYNLDKEEVQHATLKQVDSKNWKLSVTSLHYFVDIYPIRLEIMPDFTSMNSFLLYCYDGVHSRFYIEEDTYVFHRLSLEATFFKTSRGLEIEIVGRGEVLEEDDQDNTFGVTFKIMLPPLA